MCQDPMWKTPPPHKKLWLRKNKCDLALDNFLLTNSCHHYKQHQRIWAEVTIWQRPADRRHQNSPASCLSSDPTNVNVAAVWMMRSKTGQHSHLDPRSASLLKERSSLPAVSGFNKVGSVFIAMFWMLPAHFNKSQRNNLNSLHVFL